jgi:hypothetical protein
MAQKRFEFNDIFQQLSDESLELKKTIEVNKIIYPVGTKFKKGVIYGGIDFYLYKNRGIGVDLEENSEGPLRVIGFYPD